MVNIFIALPPTSRGRWSVWEGEALLAFSASQKEALSVAERRARAVMVQGQSVSVRLERADGHWDKVRMLPGTPA